MERIPYSGHRPRTNPPHTGPGDTSAREIAGVRRRLQDLFCRLEATVRSLACRTHDPSRLAALRRDTQYVEGEYVRIVTALHAAHVFLEHRHPKSATWSLGLAEDRMRALAPPRRAAG